MARFLSQVYTIIRGSVGGLTYTANQHHQLIVRAKTAPVQPNTTPQAWIRSAMTAAADGWNALSDGEQNSWDDYADQTPFSGPLGPYTVSGRNIFMAMKSMRAYITSAGLAAPSGVDTAPAPFTGFYNLGNVAPATFVGAAATGVSITMSTEKFVDGTVLISRSGPFQPARKRYKGPWITDVNQANVQVKDTSVVYDFDGLEEDARYFMRVKCVADDAPGRVSPEFIVNSIAVTNV